MWPIQFNAKDKTAAARYAVIAVYMKLGGETVEEKVGLLVKYLRGMNDKLNIPQCIKNYGADSYPTEQGFVPEDVFLDRLHDIAVNAVADALTGIRFLIRNTELKEKAMEYRRYGETYYIRLDRGDEIPRCILDMCSREDIRSAVFTGIGGCSSAELQTFDPERRAFDTEKIEGMLEMASLTGNIITGENGMLSHHTHAVFSLRTGNGQKVCAGHLKTTTVLYTAEIELRPVTGGVIGKKHDPETGTEFWDFY